jgi:hypothetical protein
MVLYHTVFTMYPTQVVHTEYNICFTVTRAGQAWDSFIIDVGREIFVECLALKPDRLE